MQCRCRVLTLTFGQPEQRLRSVFDNVTFLIEGFLEADTVHSNEQADRLVAGQTYRPTLRCVFDGQSNARICKIIFLVRPTVCGFLRRRCVRCAGQPYCPGWPGDQQNRTRAPRSERTIQSVSRDLRLATVRCVRSACAEWLSLCTSSTSPLAVRLCGIKTPRSCTPFL